MNPLAAIFLGAGLGGLLRHLLASATTRTLGSTFPYGTFSVNLLGALILGLLVGYWGTTASGQGASPLMRAFLVTGVLGGFTTFSAFTLESTLLLEKNQLAPALAYILASVCGSILMLVLGLWLARHLAA